MAHPLSPPPSPLLSPILTRTNKTTALPLVRCQPQHGAVQARPENLSAQATERRAFVWGSIGVAMGLILSGEHANAAQKRPPAKPPKEKQDPNLSAVQAKILASKKRKEAMKEEVERLKEKGKLVK